MKKISFVPLLIAVAMLLSSCGTATDSQQTEPKFEAVSMYDLSRAMLGATDKLSDMSYAGSSDDDAEDNFFRVCDEDEFSYSKVAGYFILYASDGSQSADEIVVIAVKDENDVQAAKAQLQEHLDYRISQYKTYGPDKVPQLEDAQIFTESNYAVLISAEDAEAVHTAFSDFIK